MMTTFIAHLFHRVVAQLDVRRSALPLPTSVFQRDNAPYDGEKKRASLSNMEQSE